jgi:hypothetical protein
MANACHVNAATLDHRALLLKLEDTPDRYIGCKQFHYETMWERHPELKHTFATAWTMGNEGSSVLDVKSTLGSLSRDLGRWGDETFGIVIKEIKQLKAELDRLRNLPNRAGPCQTKISVNGRLVELYRREELMWRQRSRIEWLSDGDKNSKFFHQRASMRRRKNLIKALTGSDGQTVEDPEALKSMMNDFYKNLFTSEGVQDMHNVLDHVPRKVSAQMNDTLTTDFTEEDVKKALFQMFPTKAPGPDGFPAHFFQWHWEVCGADVTMAVMRIV